MMSHYTPCPCSHQFLLQLKHTFEASIIPQYNKCMHAPVLLENLPAVQRRQSKQQKASPLRAIFRVPGRHGSLHTDCGTWALSQIMIFKNMYNMMISFNHMIYYTVGNIYSSFKQFMSREAMHVLIYKLRLTQHYNGSIFTSDDVRS